MFLAEGRHGLWTCTTESQYKSIMVDVFIPFLSTTERRTLLLFSPVSYLYCVLASCLGLLTSVVCMTVYRCG